MNRLRRNGEWSVVLFVVALLLFNPPVLSIFSVPDLLFGIPTLYLYIFVAWGGVIVLLALNVSSLIESESPPPETLRSDDDDVVGDGSGERSGSERRRDEGSY